MYVGILTAPLRKKPLAELIPWAAAQGVRGLEIEVRPGSHQNVIGASDAELEQIQGLLAQHQVQISSLACYVSLVGVPAAQVEQGRSDLEQAIELAARLGVNTVCTLAGFPAEGKDRTRTIVEDVPAAFRSVLDLAGQRGVRLALENWYRTNIQHLDHWRAIFQAVPDAHFGLNFDPSHLDWQGIDVTAALREFRDRIFHVHAKDVAVEPAVLARVGYLRRRLVALCAAGLRAHPLGRVYHAAAQAGLRRRALDRARGRRLPARGGLQQGRAVPGRAGLTGGDAR